MVIDNKLQFKEHVAQATGKATRIVGLIRRSFDHLSDRMFVQLFKSLVRPVLEYGHCIWQPYQKSLCSDIEDVQRRATKLLSSIKDKEYPERLRILRLPTLEHRRLRGDMIEVYKYLHGYYDVRMPGMKLADGRVAALRGHSLKLEKARHHLNIRGNFFGHRVVANWNDLPENVIAAPSINAFKSRLDRHWHALPSLYVPTCQC